MGCQYQTSLKSMNMSALNLYKCGHIQKVEASICSLFWKESEDSLSDLLLHPGTEQ